MYVSAHTLHILLYILLSATASTCVSESTSRVPMASHGVVQIDSQLAFVSPDDVEWNEVPEAEVRQWFERHPTLESWLPYNADDSSVAYFKTFMHWLRIRKENTTSTKSEPCVEQIIALKRGVTADMVWLWLQSEHVTKEELYKLVLHAANMFHKKAGYCLVYHANTFMAEQLILERLLESQIQEMGLPRAVRQCMQDADLPPPKVPDSDDEVSSFGGDASENDQDAQKT